MLPSEQAEAQLAKVAHECEDSAQLEAHLEWAQRTNPHLRELAAVRAGRGWSHPHFLAICVVVLARAAAMPAPEPKPSSKS